MQHNRVGYQQHTRLASPVTKRTQIAGACREDMPRFNAILPTWRHKGGQTSKQTLHAYLVGGPLACRDPHPLNQSDSWPRTGIMKRSVLLVVHG